MTTTRTALLSKVDPAELKNVPTVALILANLLPLYGVLFLGWQVFPVLVLFWIENVIIGVFNVLKMLTARPATPLAWAAKVLMVPFFCVHYGMFTFVHGIFVFALFGGAFADDGGLLGTAAVFEALGEFQLGWAVLALFVSHAVSFAYNYIGKGEYRTASLNSLMGEPYVRIVLLHITIIVGGFIITLLSSPVYALVVLIGAKVIGDVYTHIRQHRKYREVNAAAQ
jgi:hypothetical protein